MKIEVIGPSITKCRLAAGNRGALPKAVVPRHRQFDVNEDKIIFPTHKIAHKIVLGQSLVAA